MLYLDEFIKDLKRVNQYGDEDVTSDEPTADIVRWINKFVRWGIGLGAWWFNTKEFTIAITSGNQDVTLDSTIKKIEGIGNNEGGYLSEVSIKEALQWHTPAHDEDDTSVLGFFANMGVDSSGNRKIRIYGVPSESGTLTAYGQLKVVAKTVSDIATPADFQPFTDEFMEGVQEMVSARIQQAKGNATWPSLMKLAKDEMLLLYGRENSSPAHDMTSPLPDYYRLRKRLRRGGRIV